MKAAADELAEAESKEGGIGAQEAQQSGQEDRAVEPPVRAVSLVRLRNDLSF